MIDIKIGDMKGVPVIYLQTDERAGFTKGPVFDAQKNVCGFTMDMDGITLGKKYIAMDDILRMDRNSILVFNENSIRKFSHKKKNSAEEPYIGQKVQSKEGKKLGTVKDLVFNSETGNIEGLEVSRGFLEDIVDGRNIVLMRDGVEFAEEFIIVEGGENVEKK